MNAILITDLHLTDRPIDEYRWALFPWLASVVEKHSVSHLFVLGDFTDEKDRHPARLVNRIVDGMHRVKSAGLKKAYILRGNHDGIDPNMAYFRFLGKYPDFVYVETPFSFPLDGKEICMLPHSRDPVKDWEPVEMERADFVLMHATVRGALAENGQALDGIPPGCLVRARKAKIYSGDVHVPQKCGVVEYVGAPYPIRFADKFQGRAVLIEGWKKFSDLHPPAIQRKTITVTAAGLSAKDLKGLVGGDQIKLRVKLAQSEFGDWQEVKKNALKECEALGVQLCDIELERAPQQPVAEVESKKHHIQVKPEGIVSDFCKTNKLSKEVESIGLTLLKDGK